MAQNSQVNKDDRPRNLIEAQLRECFGRVVYSHKTHEKCADILLARLSHIKLWQIGLSSITVAGFLFVIFGSSKVGGILGAFIAVILLCLNTYTKDYDLGEMAQKHKQAANDIWLLREKYLALITDLRAGKLSLEKVTAKRDELIDDLHVVYSGAPSTNSRAYKQAQVALQLNEDFTFSDDEINSFLPLELHKN